MQIIYVHHAERKKEKIRNQNEDITKLGTKDCKITNQLLKNLSHVSAIYSSQFFRCQKTAKLINKNINAPIFTDTRLDEYKSVKDETWVDLQTRIINFIDDILNKYNNDAVIICVTSGVNLAGFMCKAFNLTPSKDTPILSVPSCSPIGFNFKK